jgi:CelD/BcsL family acetyltransferase involved in cellulose biosynthesis
VPSHRIQVVSDPAGAQRCWDRLSPRKTIYDEWNFRWCFARRHPEWELHFIMALSDNSPVALLPLQRVSADWLEFMGGNFMEDNRVFVKPGHEHVIPQLFERVTAKASLRGIIDDGHPFLSDLPLGSPKYTYDIRGIDTLDALIDRVFRSKSKANLSKKVRAIERIGPVIRTNSIDDIDLLAEHNVRAFGEESSFVDDPAQKEIFKDLCDLFPYFIHTYLVAGKTQGVSFSLIHNKTYLYLLSGTNNHEVPNLGNYLILNNIRTAIENGCETFDAGRHDCNWKERWHLSRTEEHIFEKP